MNLMKPIVIRALFALTGLIVLYVLYTHIASLARGREYRQGSFHEEFASIESLSSRFEVENKGLALSVDKGVLRVGGHAAGGGDASVRLLAKPRRLDDADRVGMRFRIAAPSDADIGIGFESDDGRTLELSAIARGADFTVVLQGDGNATGRPALVTRALTRPAITALDKKDDASASDAGSPDRSDANGETSPDNARLSGNEWHELTLTLDSALHGIAVSFDEVPIGSMRGEWRMGTRVRPYVRVATKSTRDIAIEVQAVNYDEQEADETAWSFSDDFSGKAIDPRRWTVALADDWHAPSHLTLVKGKGIVFATEAQHVAQFITSVELHTKQRPLTTIRARARFGLRDAKNVGIALGMQGVGYTRPSILDVGVIEGDNRRTAFVAGHWGGSGQLAIESFPGVWVDDDGSVEIAYDEATTIATVKICQKQVFQRAIDLQPFDNVEMRMHIDLHGTPSHASGEIRQFSVE